MSTKPRDIQVGIEVEVNWPETATLPRELHAQLWPAIARYRGSQDLGSSRASEPLPDEATFNSLFYGFWHNSRSNSSSRTPTPQSIALDALPAPYCLPKGWLRMTDGSAGQEFKFDGPTSNTEEIMSRISNLTAFFDAYRLTKFSNAGTHIHLGMMDWLNKRFGLVGLLRTRAENLANLYFNTRSNVLHKLMPATRRDNEFCQFPFSHNHHLRSKLRITPTPGVDSLDTRTRGSWILNAGQLSHAANLPFDVQIDHRTPAWAIHNLAISNAQPRSLLMSGAIVNQRHLPTFEFRMFPGTASKYDLAGYYRLVRAMFDRFAKIIEDEKSLAAVEKEEDSPLVVNPYQFNLREFLSEIESPSLRNWIKETHERNGACPQNDTADATASSFIPEPVAA